MNNTRTDRFGNKCDAYGNIIGSSSSTPRKPTKKELIEEIKRLLGTNELVLVDDFDVKLVRHVCSMGKKIWLLRRKNMDVPTPVGVLNIDFYMCTMCRKAYIDKNSLEFL